MINTLSTGKMRKKWMATAVRLLLFALLFAQHGPTATSWATDDANGSAAASLSAAEHESVVDNFFAAYFEQPCCVRPRHVRHHKSESFISYFVLFNTQVQKKKVVKMWLGTVKRMFTYTVCRKTFKLLETSRRRRWNCDCCFVIGLIFKKHIWLCVQTCSAPIFGKNRLCLLLISPCSVGW